MIGFVISTLVSACLLYVVGRLVSGIEVRDGKAALFGALTLGFANMFIKPLLLKLALPITILTLGLFVVVINALMLMLTAAFVDGFEVEDFWSAMWGAIALFVMQMIAGLLLGGLM